MATRQELEDLLEESLGFLCIACCKHANANPKGRLNANELVAKIQVALKKPIMPPLSMVEVRDLKKEMRDLGWRV